MSTPHISAEPGDFAPSVLMPGDPRRARKIAETFFDDARLVTEVRGIEGWTGTYQGRPISVLASGMGSPSVTIYATELFRFYGVRNIVRVGTAGGLADELKLGDVVIASAAHTDSAMATLRIPGVHFSAAPDYALLAAAVNAAADQGIDATVGPIFSGDHFYLTRPDTMAALIAHGTLCVEMEAAALFAAASAEGGRALTVVTISDHLPRHERLTAAEREDCYADMTKVALQAVAAPAVR